MFSRGFAALAIFVLFCSHADAAADFSYKAFPFVSAKTNLAKEPTRLRVGKHQLRGLMRPHSGTHLIWKVEQVYVSSDLRRRVFVKHQVQLNSTRPLGGWHKVARGHVLHLRSGKHITAYYAEGFNGKELYDIEKQFRKKSAVASLMLLPSAHADEAVSADTDPDAGTAAPAAGTPLLDRIGNISMCVGQQTVEDAMAAAKVVMENATWEKFQQGVVDTVGATWNGAVNGFVGTGQFLHGAVTDPGKTWNNITTGFSESGAALAKLAGEIGSSIAGFPELAEPVQDEIICHFITKLSQAGLLTLALAATGAGAGLGAAKLGITVTALVARITPLIPVLKALKTAKDMTVDKMREITRNLLQEKVTPAQAEHMVAGNDHSQGVDLPGVPANGVLPGDHELSQSLGFQPRVFEDIIPPEKVAQYKADFGEDGFIKVTDDGHFVKGNLQVTSLKVTDPAGNKVSTMEFGMSGDNLMIAGTHTGAAYQKKGVTSFLFQQAVGLHPEARRLTGAMADDNYAILQDGYKRLGLPCEEAAKRTPFYKSAASVGFTEIIDVNCMGRDGRSMFTIGRTN